MRKQIQLGRLFSVLNYSNFWFRILTDSHLRAVHISISRGNFCKMLANFPPFILMRETGVNKDAKSKYQKQNLKNELRFPQHCNSSIPDAHIVCARLEKVIENFPNNKTPIFPEVSGLLYEFHPNAMQNKNTATYLQ